VHLSVPADRPERLVYLDTLIQPITETVERLTKERERTGYYRGLCTAGQGLTDDAVEKCREIHP